MIFTRYLITFAKINCMKKYLYLLIISAGLAACKAEPKEIANRAKEDKEVVEQNTATNIQVDPDLDALATYLGAASDSSFGKYKNLTDKGSWTTYKTKMDILWQKTENKLPLMESWAEKELNEMNQASGTLFYPFSGPDFLHADLFFPNFDSIIMIGLEPIGDLPDPLSYQTDSLVNYYNGMHQSLYAILGLSFFRTVAMAEDFTGEVDGTLPVFLHFLNRRQYEVLNLKKVIVLPDGTLSTDLTQANDSSYYGNQLQFRKSENAPVKTLIYFSVNLQNTPYGASKGLSTRNDFTQFLKKSNINSTYLKSASYLMHRPSFSIIRNLILGESEFLLQDDSGIPLSFFDKNKWELTFYGTYTKPISLFASRHQEDLKEAFENKENTVKKLPFGIGYMYKNGSSNLMKARKK